MGKMYSATPEIQELCTKLEATGMSEGSIQDILQRLINNGPEIISSLLRLLAIFSSK